MAMKATDIFDIFTMRKVFVRIVNLKVDGIGEDGQVDYAPQVKVTIGKDGIELATFIGDALEDVLNQAYRWANDNSIIHDAPEWLPQCETCMRRICNQPLKNVCNYADNEYRHALNQDTQEHDWCLYKIYWSKYPDAHWRKFVPEEDFEQAKQLCASNTSR